MAEPVKVLVVFDGCTTAEHYASRILIALQSAGQAAPEIGPDAMKSALLALLSPQQTVVAT